MTHHLSSYLHFFFCSGYTHFNFVLDGSIYPIRHVRLAYQPPTSNIFLSEQTNHQQPARSTFLSEQISTSHQHQPNEHAGWDTCLHQKIGIYRFM
jgi:hypothetical protein